MCNLPIGPIIALLLIACLVGLGMRWIKQPYTIALVLVGLVIALTKLTPQISLTHDAAFFIILPPILFYGGMHLNLEHLKQDWKPIVLLAIPGVVISAFLVGYPLSYFWHIPLNYALLFGALISPTDPVSVLAIMKKIKAPERLRTILEAESLFNDGTGVVLFMVILTMIQNKEPLNLGTALFQFLLVTGGGALVGGLCGFLIHQLLKTIEDHLLEVTLTVVLAFGAPLLAESMHCSGIIAVVVAGLMMGKGRLSCMTSKSRETVETFWEVIDFIMNSLIFLMIGIQLQVIGKNDLFEFKGLILMGVMAVLISRILIVYPTIYGFNRILKPSIPFIWNHVIFWGGLRGTIPIILMLQLPEFQYRSLFLAATFGVVLFSIIIQGLTIEPLLKKFKLQQK
jgi:CPA1 family monovalent cation:H+ antiporter